jgi:hypothetical protein
MFVWDDEGRFTLPRVMLEGVGHTWSDSRVVMFNLQQPDGRTLVFRGEGEPVPVHDAKGRPRVFAGGPLRFECVEPFVHWRMEFDGLVTDTTAPDILAGRTPAPGDATVPVRVQLEAHSELPPWLFESREPRGAFPPQERRFEQLFRTDGALTLDGAETSFSGGGLRIHRVGGNRGSTGDYYGHCWQTAHFADGRAFGFIRYHPRPDGSEKYSEGWLTDGDTIEPAWAEDVPWMGDPILSGEDVSFTLTTRTREVKIEAETAMSWITPGDSSYPSLQTGVTRCTWDGVRGQGMIERAVAPDA